VDEAKKVAHVPSIVFRLEKNLRDMIAHPGVEKYFDIPGTSEKVLDNYGATYERLDFRTLERFEARISPWVDAICGAFGVTRLEATEAALNEFIEGLPNPALLKKRVLGTGARSVLERTQKPVFIVPLPSGTTSID